MILQLTLFTILIVIYILHHFTKKPRGFPPGPKWWPFVGCYHHVKKNREKVKFFHLVTHLLTLKYGSVIGLRMGQDLIVTVSGYENVREVLHEEVFEGRPDGFFYRLRSFGHRLGVVFVDGEFMHEQRRFSLHQLRSFGLGKDKMFQVISYEANQLAELIDFKRKSGAVQVNQLFDISVLNTIWAIIAGCRFELDDETLRKLTYLVHSGFHLVDISGGVLNQMPFLRFVAPSLTGYNLFQNIVDEIMTFLKAVVSDHKINKNDDFIGAFLKKIEKTGEKGHSSYTENQLLVLLEDLFMAGMETTSSTLTFAILYLVKHKDVQLKIHQELDKVVGSCRSPCVADKNSLVYLEATIMEIQRHANPVPITIPHLATQDTQLNGYQIPMVGYFGTYSDFSSLSPQRNVYILKYKGTIVLPSLWSVHMDENYWHNPNEFNPSRFLDQENNLLHHSHFMPFSMGRRRCIGEILGKTTVYLFLATLLHKFEISAVDPVAEVEIIDGITLTPAPFEIIFEPRIII